MTDPADSEQLCQVISYQGAALGRHDEALQTLSDQMAQLVSAFNGLRTELSSPTLPVPAPVPEPVSPPPPRLQREPQVAPPERYAGEPHRCRDFLMQCSLVLASSRRLIPQIDHALPTSSGSFQGRPCPGPPQCGVQGDRGLPLTTPSPRTS